MPKRTAWPCPPWRSPASQHWGFIFSRLGLTTGADGMWGTEVAQGWTRSSRDEPVALTGHAAPTSLSVLLFSLVSSPFLQLLSACPCQARPTARVPSCCTGRALLTAHCGSADQVPVPGSPRASVPGEQPHSPAWSRATGRSVLAWKGDWHSGHSHRQGQLTSQNCGLLLSLAQILPGERQAPTNGISVTSEGTVLILVFIFLSYHKDLKKEKANLSMQSAISNQFSSF